MLTNRMLREDFSQLQTRQLKPLKLKTTPGPDIMEKNDFHHGINTLPIDHYS